MKRIASMFAVLVISGLPAKAQSWVPWGDPYGDRYERSWRVPPPPPQAYRPQAERPARGVPGGIWDGGARPAISPQAPPIVPFTASYPANSIIIDTSGRTLYYVLPGRRAYQYRISVGREGFSWNGRERISRKQAWPDWNPPAEMRQRDRSLPSKMTGSLRNPLGAMALYLGNTLYRIHGTNDPGSIGRAASSGCFRMMNANVIHLASLASVGTTVTVVRSLPRQQLQVSASRAQVLVPGGRSVRGGLRMPPPPAYYDPDEED